MPTAFPFDVFLSHSSADKAKVERIAKRLQEAGLEVWFDKWVIRPGDDILLEIEHGLEGSRTVVLVLSRASMASDWVLLERNTTMFRDPANRSRRFIPVLIDDCLDLVPDTVKRFKHIDLRRPTRKAYEELVQACRR